MMISSSNTLLGGALERDLGRLKIFGTSAITVEQGCSLCPTLSIGLRSMGCLAVVFEGP